jgi:hypothetical protein
MFRERCECFARKQKGTISPGLSSTSQLTDQREVAALKIDSGDRGSRDDHDITSGRLLLTKRSDFSNAEELRRYSSFGWFWSLDQIQRVVEAMADQARFVIIRDRVQAEPLAY